MKRMDHVVGVLGLLLALVAIPVVAAEPRPAIDLSPREDLNDGEMPLEIGGLGGVYFLVEPGELVVDVFKRDLGKPRSLRAILVGPDRRVVQEQVIPRPSAEKGSATAAGQRIRFSTRVQKKGVYALNITDPGDRYGTALRWGFRTNCAHYLIETSRGHRDSAHEEPIVVDSPTHGGDICFLPRPNAFEIDLSKLAKTVSIIDVFDAADHLVTSIAVDAKGNANHHFSADPTRGDLPWRLHLSVYKGTIQIDGVTRWCGRDRYRNLCCWTPCRESWFPFLENRWLATPYHDTVYRSGEQAIEETFRIHNNSQRAQTFLLQLEFPEQSWPAELSQSSVSLKAKASTLVSILAPASPAGQDRSVSLRVTPSDTPEFSTFATLTVRPGPSPAAAPLTLPITLKPYQHENEQFGYHADYPLVNEVYFDGNNKPYIVSSSQLWRQVEGSWVASDLSSARRGANVSEAAIRTVSTKIAFDQDSDLYLLGKAGETSVLLHSNDQGETFTASALPVHGSEPSVYDMDQFSGQNVPSGPPPIVRFTRTASDPNLIWRRINDLALLLPKKEGGKISFEDPIKISDQCIGFAAHSGIPSSVVSRGKKVHITWGEATDPQEKVAGVPGYVITYDRESKKLSKPALVGYGPPANDVHNTPSLTIDREGYLHLLIGTHGQPFPYARSLQPNDAGAGWTDAEPMSEERQTYVGLVTGADGTLHAVYRMWRSNAPPHPDGIQAVLAYSRKPPGKAWSTPQAMVVPAFADYSVFYHRLTIDHAGRLWLSYDYWSTLWFYRNDHFGSRRTLLTSSDGGTTWYLATGDHSPAP